ncbi:septum formation family protein [Gleimia sp. 6138-11-ORH1]|uniref:septum formation family protein n=1 Tax=Gleimia sp. 6138-11-ORH1 TaxID=2973937 RepID=UPI002167B7D2|nr:septum formation family protein [Gleimia sp. 6138-11-ORH1]MCS4484682.1 septum formation family protein [Gleimia sp. 6138-11-ORH1]
MRGKTKKLLAVAAASALALTGCGSAVVELSKSDCLDLPENTLASGVFDLENLTTVPCSSPHNAEVVDTLHLPEGPFPGNETIIAQVEAFCPQAFSDYIGKDPKDSIFDLAPLSPTQESWEKAKDRAIICLAFSQHEKISGTFKNSGR